MSAFCPSPIHRPDRRHAMKTETEAAPTGMLARYCPCGHTANYHRATPEMARQYGCTGKEGNKPGAFGAYHCRCSATLADVIEHGLVERPTGLNATWSS